MDDDNFDISNIEMDTDTTKARNRKGIRKREQMEGAGAVVEEQQHAKKRRQEDLKKKHNLTSQRGRQKINQEIQNLKDLLPDCKQIECNKASVLHCAVQTLEKLLEQQKLFIEIEKENAQLRKQNKQLWDELQQFRNGGTGISLNTSSIQPDLESPRSSSDDVIDSTTQIQANVFSPNSQTSSSTSENELLELTSEDSLDQQPIIQVSSNPSIQILQQQQSQVVQQPSIVIAAPTSNQVDPLIIPTEFNQQQYSDDNTNQFTYNQHHFIPAEQFNAEAAKSASYYDATTMTLMDPLQLPTTFDFGYSAQQTHLYDPSLYQKGAMIQPPVHLPAILNGNQPQGYNIAFFFVLLFVLPFGFGNNKSDNFVVQGAQRTLQSLSESVSSYSWTQISIVGIASLISLLFVIWTIQMFAWKLSSKQPSFLRSTNKSKSEKLFETLFIHPSGKGKDILIDEQGTFATLPPQKESCKA